MTIQIDTREKPHAIQHIVDYFDAHGVEHFSKKLDVGDYMNPDHPNLVIDRKQNLLELCKNVSTVPLKDERGRIKRGTDGKPLTDHARFCRELERARNSGIKLIILCEHGGQIKVLPDVETWRNPRLKESPLALSGFRLYRILKTLETCYGVTFMFCAKHETGMMISKILNGEWNGYTKDLLGRL